LKILSLFLLSLQKVVILKDTFCHGRIPPWAVVQGLEKCRFGIENLSTEEYIELSTLQDEIVHKPWLSLKDFDEWVASNKVIPAPTTSTTRSPITTKQEGQKKPIWNRTIKKNPIPTKTTTPFSGIRSTTTTTSTDLTTISPDYNVDVTTSVSLDQNSIISSTTVSAVRAESGDTIATSEYSFSCYTPYYSILNFCEQMCLAS
jgi:hypothetical protein